MGSPVSRLRAAPLVLAAVWGVRTTGAFLAGLVLAQVLWMLLVAWTTGADRARALRGAPALYLAATALVALQFVPLVQAWEPSRTVKVLLLGAVVAAIVLWLLIAGQARRDVGEGGSAPEPPES